MILQPAAALRLLACASRFCRRPTLGRRCRVRRTRRDDVLRSLEAGRRPVILTERRDHLDHLRGRFEHFTKNLVVLYGGMTTAERRETEKRLKTPDTEERLVLATGRYLGEGFDDASLDTLFLTMPISWRGT